MVYRRFIKINVIKKKKKHESFYFISQVASEPSTPQSLKKTNKKNISGSDFIIFQREVSVPPALYCKINGSPGTPAASKKVKKS